MGSKPAGTLRFQRLKAEGGLRPPPLPTPFPSFAAGYPLLPPGHGGRDGTSSRAHRSRNCALGARPGFLCRLAKSKSTFCGSLDSTSGPTRVGDPSFPAKYLGWEEAARHMKPALVLTSDLWMTSPRISSILWPDHVAKTASVRTASVAGLDPGLLQLGQQPCQLTCQTAQTWASLPGVDIWGP